MNGFRRDLVTKIAAVVLLASISSPGWAKGAPQRSILRWGPQVRAWEGTITIPTYGWAEDVNPKFWDLEDQPKLSTTVKGAIVYPYPMQDHLYRDKEDRTYKALFLENEYLKVTCLPELGGRLHSVFDKTQGKETFHLNNVVKPSMIAMRGAWIAGGVEWNSGPTGIRHNPLAGRCPYGHERDRRRLYRGTNLEKTCGHRWTSAYAPPRQGLS